MGSRDRMRRVVIPAAAKGLDLIRCRHGTLAWVGPYFLLPVSCSLLPACNAGKRTVTRANDGAVPSE